MEPIGKEARPERVVAKRRQRSATGNAPSLGIIRTGTKGLSQPAMSGEYPCVLASIACGAVVDYASVSQVDSARGDAEASGNACPGLRQTRCGPRHGARAGKPVL